MVECKIKKKKKVKESYLNLFCLLFVGDDGRWGILFVVEMRVKPRVFLSTY